MKQDIKNITFAQLASYMKEHRESSYRTQQVFSWLYQKRASEFALMKNLSKGLFDNLENDFYISELILKEKLISSDGTQKLLFKLEDANIIECVIIPYKQKNTLCLSTQVGCKYACEFCASGKLGFVRNLTQAEILNQIISVRKILGIDRINNIVFMGIGEPLENYENVLGSIRIINSKYGFAIGQRKITISTAGVIDGIKRLSQEGLQIELSVSLHSADDSKRSKIMSINKKYPLSKLIPCLREFVRITKRKVTFEYMLLGGFNTGLKDAQSLIKLIKGINCKVNLIAFNLICDTGFLAPIKLEVLFFRNYLLKNHIDVTVRQPRGQDIQAACGQLRLHRIKEKNKSASL